MSHAHSAPPTDADTANPVADVYANTLRVNVTNWDLSLIFGQTDDTGANRGVPRERVAIRLSPQMAKHLLLSLQSGIAAYEDVFGGIPVTAGNRADYEASRRRIEEQLRQQNEIR